MIPFSFMSFNTLHIIAQADSCSFGRFIELGGSVLIGAGTAMFAQFVADRLHKRRALKQQLMDYASVLSFARTELEFYLEKLTVLLDDLRKANDEVSYGRHGIVIPTYDFFPLFLEKTKVSVSQFARSSQPVELLGKCHFELAHVTGRLNQVKDVLLAYSESPRAQRLNAGGYLNGFIQLVENADLLFKTAIPVLDDEANRARSEATELDRFSNIF